MTDLERWNEFAEAAYLNKKHSPWFQRKQPGNIYANIMITDCQQPDWWYAPFIGIECFVQLRFTKYPWQTIDMVREADVVQIRGVGIVTGRGISSKDFIIL